MYLVKIFKNVRMTFNFLFNLTVLIRFMVKKGRDGKYTHSLDMHFIESIANYIYFSEYRNYHDEYTTRNNYMAHHLIFIYLIVS